MRVANPASDNVDLRDIKIVKKIEWADYTVLSLFLFLSISISLFFFIYSLKFSVCYVLLYSHSISIPPRGTVDDTELVDGVIFDKSASHVAGGVERVEKAKIAFIQFCLSAPKTDVSYFSVWSLNIKWRGFVFYV